jgi:hypothetical protein
MTDRATLLQHLHFALLFCAGPPLGSTSTSSLMLMMPHRAAPVMQRISFFSHHLHFILTSATSSLMLMIPHKAAPVDITDGTVLLAPLMCGQSELLQELMRRARYMVVS